MYHINVTRMPAGTNKTVITLINDTKDHQVEVQA